MTETPPAAVESKKENRPFFLSILCVSLFVYTGILSLIFLLSIIFYGWISNTLADFFPEREIVKTNILWLSIIAFLLSGASFYATFLMWRLKKSGLFLFILSSLAFQAFPFLFGFGNYYSLIIILVIIVLLLLYWRRFT